MAALLFLAFAYFAVGQASVARNGAQTAADAAALGAARTARDGVKADFLTALTAGDIDKLNDLLAGVGMDGDGAACTAATTYAADNHADRTNCDRVNNPPGYAVGVLTQGTVGNSVVAGTENMHAQARATAVVESVCTAEDAGASGVTFSCDTGTVTVDPTAVGFQLNLAEFYSVHLSS